MTINSRQKGKRGELEIASKLCEYGFEARRGVQYNGGDGSADVVGLPGLHLEIKRNERLNVYDGMAQAKGDARDDEMPTVMWRKNHCEWLVTMRLEDWIKIYSESEANGLFKKLP